MDHCMEVRSRSQHLVVVYGEMGVELAGDVVETALDSRVNGCRLAVFINHQAGNVGGGIFNDLAQPAARAADQEGRAFQFRYCLGQFDLACHREVGARLQVPHRPGVLPGAQADRYVSGCSFAGFDLGQVTARLSHHV